MAGDNQVMSGDHHQGGGGDHECDNWEISLSRSTPNLLDLDPNLGAGEENMKLSPRDPVERGDESVSTMNMDECWMINIKSPASLNVTTGDPDDQGFAVNIFSRMKKKMQ